MKNQNKPPKMIIGFIGLGVMGSPVASHLAKNNFTIKAYNRSPSKSARWLAANPNNIIANSPAEAASGADAVILFVGNDKDVHQTLFAKNGVTATATKGTIVIDHTTTSARLAQTASAKLSQWGIDLLDAPVSGGQLGAEQGRLAIMVGGKKSAFNKAKPIMNCYAKTIALIGPNGDGQRAKMINQICHAGTLQGLSEALLFGEASGVDVKKVLEVIKHGAASSWQMENSAPTMLRRKFNFGFAIDWMRKDLDICLAEAKNFKMKLPNANRTNNLYKKLQKMGHGKSDTSALIEAVAKEIKKT